MSEVNIFEVATKTGLRFNTPVGNISVEDAWNLPLTSAKGVSLDSVAKSVNKELKTLDEESFVTPSTNTGRSTLELKLTILKHIIEVRLEERKSAELKTANQAKKKRILEILSEKQDKALYEKDAAELEKMLDEL